MTLHRLVSLQFYFKVIITIGLNINHRKTELMCLNISQTTAVKIEGKDIAKAEKNHLPWEHCM
jgi:hypothetical protein